MSRTTLPKASPESEVSTWISFESGSCAERGNAYALQELASLHIRPSRRPQAEDGPLRPASDGSQCSQNTETRRGSKALETSTLKHPSKLRRRCIWFDTYNVLMVIVLVVNAAALLAFAIRNRDGPSRALALRGTLTAVSVNIFFALLIRQEIVLNLFYDILSRVPPTAPFLLRKHLANFHHFGGMHAACAVSALVWYIVYLCLQTQSLLASITTRRTPLRIVDISASYIVLVLLIATILTSLPQVRRTHHDVFERVHRFAGWATVLALWLHTIVVAADPDSDSPPSASASATARNPSLYLLALITILLILPWLRIRKVPVTPHTMSGREIRLSFPYNDMPSTSTMRFSLSPLTEWHAFTTIPGDPTSTSTTNSNNDASKESSILVAAQGDWTRSLLASPPTHVWLRDPPTRNFLSAVYMFDSVLLVATGAGIGPVVSLLATLPSSPPASASAAHQNAAGIANAPAPRAENRHCITFGSSARRHTPRLVKVLWIASHPHATYYSFIIHAIRRVDPDALILDSREGRPEIEDVVGRVVRREGIEGRV
ncbi:uncharacterized protein EI97DRAFT_181710 [Westerdykella ornata]|uniref:FAD-binding FR-type domain-containing protein n=1 Tax=Westerdykella ornata TaxID=318751 RepID=A0A6A6JUX3_WESOR|nr:uncharacterized protein EI97DRAFT_181710 [Westerdykella ornata]KAF2279618.1 hypothetical protein EI97DRAFT_181710 [Westerdykella ornata]